MHQTTIRFDSELWLRIDAESSRIGVSAAQYIRDATLIRLTHEARAVGSAMTRSAGSVEDATAAIAAADEISNESRAVWAQARQARERARLLRDASRRLGDARALRPWAGPGWVEQTTGEDRG